MLIIFVRVIVLYLLVFFIIRLTGKRQLGDLQPFDLVITLLIADLASIPAANTGVPLIYGIVPILALFLLQQLFSFLSLKSEVVRRFMCGKSVIMIKNGVVQEEALGISRYTLNDLTEQLRSKDVFDISKVAYAILETNGELSVLLKGPKQVPDYEAAGIATKPQRPPFVLIVDGNIHGESLKKAGYEQKWLEEQLKSCGFSSEKEVFFAFLMSDGLLHLQGKKKYNDTPMFLDTNKGGENG